MHSIAVLTINGKRENEEDLVKIIEDASSYFPAETWDHIKYIGRLGLEHDFKVAKNREAYGAFLFQRLISRIKEIRNRNRLMNLLLGVTADPIVAVYPFFDGTGFKNALYLVHDYVDERAGVVSFFRVDEEFSNKLVAHGLGHNRGLCHHLEPIDLMYSELLSTSILRVNGFCEVCLRKLTKEETDAPTHTH
ncbi:MAG: hypothetical protein JSV57_04830 [Candidatus Bathyarchaeota archaeon]|nr:MAG: hypothetical protein JSV57_04830 [Candidatus Bathyarchaeota archaeon]